jgi:hypothetical protein
MIPSALRRGLFPGALPAAGVAQGTVWPTRMLSENGMLVRDAYFLLHFIAQCDQFAIGDDNILTRRLLTSWKGLRTSTRRRDGKLLLGPAFEKIV